MRGRWSMFKTWVDAAAFLPILVAALCGYFHAPLWSAVMAAITLSVLTWGADRWTELVGKARELDAQWREIAVLAWDRGLPLRAAWYYLRG